MTETTAKKIDGIGARGAVRATRRLKGLSDRAIAWWFVGPTVALLLAINIFPLVWNIYLSFTNCMPMRRKTEACGRARRRRSISSTTGPIGSMPKAAVSPHPIRRSAMSPELKTRLIDAAVETIRDNADLLGELDRAIGDGDHGLNMKRGFEAIAEQRDDLAGMPWPQALQKAGMALVMKVGDASGPLYGSLLMQMGKAAPEAFGSLDGVIAAFTAGIEAVMKRGKSTTGEKTMLDVLVPVNEALKAAQADGGGGSAAMAAARQAADQGLAATNPLQATKGRASFLGERSIGHDDPGATSSRLLIHAVCDVLESPGENDL